MKKRIKIILIIVFSIFSYSINSGNVLGDIVILNESDPYMTKINELNVGGGALDIKIKNDIAYVLSSKGLDLYNISDPEITNYVGHYYGSGFLGHSLVLYNNYVITANDNQGIKIIDVGNIENPILANTYEQSRPASVYIKDQILFVANYDNDFEVYDLSNLPNLLQLSHFPGQGYHKSYPFEDIVFVFANDGSFDIFNVENPSEIIKLGTYSDQQNIRCASVIDDLAYIGGEGGVRVLGISDLSAPTIISSYQDDPEAWISNLEVRDNTLFVADVDLGFRMINITDPLNPVEIGRNPGGSPLAFQVLDDIAFVASQERGVEVIELEYQSISRSTTDSRILFFGDILFIIPLFYIIVARKVKRDYIK